MEFNVEKNNVYCRLATGNKIELMMVTNAYADSVSILAFTILYDHPFL